MINPNPQTPFPQCSRMWLVDRRPLIGRARTGFPLPMKLQNYLSLDLNLFSTSSSKTHFTFRFIFYFIAHSVLQSPFIYCFSFRVIFFARCRVHEDRFFFFILPGDARSARQTQLCDLLLLFTSSLFHLSLKSFPLSTSPHSLIPLHLVSPSGLSPTQPSPVR